LKLFKIEHLFSGFIDTCLFKNIKILAMNLRHIWKIIVKIYQIILPSHIDYFKLKYIEEHKINFKYLVISADYFSFSLLADNSNSNYYHYFNNSYKNINDSFN
jgi:hypothetical protein